MSEVVMDAFSLFDPAARAVLEEALRVAERFGHGEVDIRHLVIAVATVDATALCEIDFPLSASAVVEAASRLSPAPWVSQVFLSSGLKVSCQVATDRARTDAGRVGTVQLLIEVRSGQADEYQSAVRWLQALIEAHGES